MPARLPCLLPGSAARVVVSSHRLRAAMLAALVATPSAHAQQSDESIAASGTEVEPAVLGTIIVTARKRDERQLDVPIAMNAITGDQIEALGLRNVVDVINTTPGATSIDTGGGVAQVQIRGVSSSLGGNDNGYYVDETPFTGVTVPWYPDTRSFDLERIEILKGPQGTLFGEGAMGGTVRILTRKPVFNQFSAGMELDASNTRRGSDGWGAKAYVNVPLIDDRLALRLVATDETTPGWITNSLTGAKNVNAADIRTWRPKLRFAPTDDWTLDLSYWKYRSETDAAPNASFDDFTERSFLSAQSEWDSASLTSTYDFADSQLVYTFSDGNIEMINQGDLAPGLAFSGAIEIGIRTHELRLASTGERRLDWTVGYYRRESERTDGTQLPALGIASQARQTNEAYALFGEATLKLPNPAWAVALGVRYFEDDVDAVDSAVSGPASTLNAKFDSWNPRVSLSYKPSAKATLYASAARGFRSGQLQPITSVILGQQFGVDLPVAIDADSIWTYELGMKSVLIENTLLFEGAVFHSDWKDVAVRVPITPQINGLANSDGTTNDGAELSLVYTPIRALTLQLGGSYMDATYSQDVPGTPLHKGTPVYNVPKTSVYGSVSYGWDVGATLRNTVSASINHNSRRETAMTAGSPGDPITLAQLRIGLESMQGWALYLYGNNLTNEDGAINARGPSEFDQSGNFVRYGSAYRPQPRTFGVQFRYDY